MNINKIRFSVNFADDNNVDINSSACFQFGIIYLKIFLDTF